MREDERLLSRKYSRHTQVEFVLFGLVTRRSKTESLSIRDLDDVSIKEAIMNLVGLITNVEASFNSGLENEVIIDPIAVYTELAT